MKKLLLFNEDDQTAEFVGLKEAAKLLATYLDCNPGDDDDDDDDEEPAPEFLKLKGWKWTLPRNKDGGTSGNAHEIFQPELETYQDQFLIRTTYNSLLCLSTAGIGARTGNSKYRRSEARQMNTDGSKASWDIKDADFQFTMKLAIHEVPNKAAGNFFQIHDESDDILMARYDDGDIWWSVNGKKRHKAIENYELGDKINLVVWVRNGQVTGWINGFGKVAVIQTLDLGNKKGCYLKWGSYENGGKSGNFLVEVFDQSLITG